MKMIVTGGTGSIGKVVCEELLKRNIIPIVLSRNDSSQEELKIQHPEIQFVIGDVTRPEDCRKVFRDEEWSDVIHCAALKHVPHCEENPEQASRVNFDGTVNMFRERRSAFVLVSTDKAVNPINVLGFTKAMAERYVLKNGSHWDRVVRLGNVIKSRGSILNVAATHLKEKGFIPVTNFSMRRFWISDKEAAKCIVDAALENDMPKVVVPKMEEELLVYTLKKHFGDDVPMKEVGARFGEKIREETHWPWEVA